MKRSCVAFALVLVASMTLVALTAGLAEAQSAIERIKKEGVLRIAFTPTNIPLNWKDPKTNEMIGSNVEAAKRFAKELGVKLEIHEMAFPATFEYLLSKRVDIVMTSVVVRPDRKLRFNFSDVAHSFGYSACVKKDETRKFSDVAAVVAEWKKGNLRVGEQTNSAFVQIIKEAGIPTTDMRLYENKQEAIRDVALGRIDITFWDTPQLQALLFITPDIAAKVKIAPEFIAPLTDNAFPIRFEDTDLLEFVNKVMAEMRRDGSWDENMRKFGLDPKDFLPSSMRK